MFSEFAHLSPRQILLQILNLCLIGSTAYMSWKGLGVLTDCESPIVVVLSGSMEPAFQRGDLLFLSNLPDLAKIGDIVVYNIRDRSIPIVHRVVKSHVSSAPPSLLLGEKKGKKGTKVEKRTNRGVRVNPFAQPIVGPQQFLLTKGDNNAADDTELYAPGQEYLERKEDVVGIVKGFMPYVGMVTLLMNDYPAFRYILLGGMAVTSLLNRE